MQNRIRTAVLAALLSLTAAPAPAQQFPQTLSSNTVYGRLGLGSGPGQAIPFTTLGAQTLKNQVPQYSIPVGRGTDVIGFSSVGPCLSGVPIIGAGISANPVCGTSGEIMSRAVCDGSTNAAATINAEAAASAGKTLLLPSGTCLIEVPVLPTVSMRGSGATIFKRKSGTTTAIASVASNFITIENISFDGNSSGAPSASTCVNVDGNNNRFINAGVSNCLSFSYEVAGARNTIRDGYFSTNYSPARFVGVNANDNVFDNNVVVSNVYGVFAYHGGSEANAPSRVKITNNFLSLFTGTDTGLAQSAAISLSGCLNCIVDSNTIVTTGYLRGIEAFANSDGSSITNNKIKFAGLSGATGHSGIDTGPIDSCTINNNTIWESGYVGLFLSGNSRCVVTGNDIRNSCQNAGAAGTGGCAGITMNLDAGNGAHKNTIVGNFVGDTQGSPTQPVGIRQWQGAASDYTYNVISRNTLTGNSSSAYVKVSTTDLFDPDDNVTGSARYAVGDLFYADTVNSRARLAGVATGNALISGGLNTAPSWGKIGISTHVSGLGTGVATALGVNIGSAGAPVLFNGAGGTPSSITLTNGTGLPTTGLTGTLQAAQEPAHTGDVTNSAGSLALTLATVNSNVGTFGSATQVGQFTVNGKGLITAASNVTVTPAVGSITGLGTGIATALAVNVGTAGAPVINGGALGSPSSAGTMPAFTLGGTVSGGGQAINNLTTLAATTSITTPLHIGGSATGQTLTFQTTTGVGSGDGFAFKGGNNGASTYATLSSVGFGIGVSPSAPIDIVTSGVIGGKWQTLSTATSVAGGSSFELANSSATNNNYNSITSRNSVGGYTSGIEMINVNHNASGSATGAIRFVTNTAGTIAEIGRFQAGFSVGSTTDPGTGVIMANSGFRSGASSGQSVTTTVRASGGAADCTLIFTGGLKTGGTC